MKIVSSPQVHQIRPLPSGVAVSFHPALLVVALPAIRVTDLAPDEPLVVVGGRIDQVPPQSLRCPLLGTEWNAALRFRDPGKLRGSIVARPLESGYQRRCVHNPRSGAVTTSAASVHS